MSRIAALIPAYQEARNIEELVHRCKSLLPEVLVIDDGSSDQTAELAQRAGARVLRHSQNSGKGQAIRSGLTELLNTGFEAVILLDGDLQHLPEEIPLFIAKFRQSDAALIIGDRSGELRHMPLIRKLTNQLMSSLIGFLCNQRIPDSQCGFRLIRTDAATTILNDCHTTNYDFETEMLVVISRAGHRIESVPITTVYRSGAVSKIRPFRDALRFVALLWKLGFSGKLLSRD